MLTLNPGQVAAHMQAQVCRLLTAFPVPTLCHGCVLDTLAVADSSYQASLGPAHQPSLTHGPMATLTLIKTDL